MRATVGVCDEVYQTKRLFFFDEKPEQPVRCKETSIGGDTSKDDQDQDKIDLK